MLFLMGANPRPPHRIDAHKTFIIIKSLKCMMQITVHGSLKVDTKINHLDIAALSSHPPWLKIARTLAIKQECMVSISPRRSE
jgi:hypothetical protein